MKTTLHTDITVADICKGLVYNEYEGKGLFGLDGKVVIQPEYQRNYIYADGRRDVAVVVANPGDGAVPFALEIAAGGKRATAGVCRITDENHTDAEIPLPSQLPPIHSSWRFSGNSNKGVTL